MDQFCHSGRYYYCYLVGAILTNPTGCYINPYLILDLEVGFEASILAGSGIVTVIKSAVVEVDIANDSAMSYQLSTHYFQDQVHLFLLVLIHFD